MNANLISFVDVVTRIFQECDASYHGCSNCNKRYLNHASEKALHDEYVTMQATGYGKQVNRAIYLYTVILELQKINLQNDPDKIRMSIDMYIETLL